MRSILAVATVLLATCGAAAAGPNLKIYGMEAKPISFLNKDEADGMAVELARELQRCTGGREAIQIVPWARANALANSEPNVLLLSAVATPERSHLTLIGPIFKSHIAAYAARGRADELRARDPSLLSLRSGGRRGSAFVMSARAKGYNLSDETTSPESAARMLMSGRFDIWWASETLAGEALELAGYHLSDVVKMTQLPPHTVHFAFSEHTDASLIKTWDRCLRQAKRDGAFERIHRKWLPGQALP